MRPLGLILTVLLASFACISCSTKPTSHAPAAELAPKLATELATELAPKLATESAANPAPIAKPQPQRPPQRQPNIVVVLADDLGYGELGCYGQRKIATPNIDLLAREGVRFTQFYSAAPVCAPSRCAFITGLHLGHAPIRDNGEVEPEGQTPMPQGFSTVAQDLKFAGYKTACVGKWGLGVVGSSGDPNALGFEHFFGFNCQRQAHNYYPTHLWSDVGIVKLEGNDPKTRKEAVYAPDLMLKEAQAFIARNAGRPFFLSYTTTLPHMALQPPAEELRLYESRFREIPYTGGRGYLSHAKPRAGYAAMITRLDAEVGALRASLEQAGVADDTIIIVTSDNGPTHDVGGVDTNFFDSTAGLRGRKGSVWEGGIRVPCIAWNPKRIGAGLTIDSPAWTVDLRATFVALAGFGPIGSDGIDLSPAILRGETIGPRSFYWPFPGYGGQQAVREGDWKLVRCDLEKLAKTSQIQQLDGWQLYDLAKDPKETIDVAAVHPDVVARLSKYAYKQHTQNSDFPLPGMD